MRYTLELDEKTVQFLVDQLRRLAHYVVDEELQSIRAQITAQEQQHAERARQHELERARQLLAETAAQKAVNEAPDSGDV